MTIFYRSYKYAPLATFISGLANTLALVAAVAAAYMILVVENKAVGITVGVILLALAVFLFVYVGRKLTDRLAEKWGPENIKKKVGMAFQYVWDNPSEYDRIAALNPAFGEKYVIGEKGKPVKRK